MTDPPATAAATSTAEPAAATPGVRQISDPKTMRALAHPIRLALLEAFQREGELTATRAAELLGESPGNMSWHLQTLAKYGYIEEVEGAKGRARPWRAKRSTNRFAPDESDPASVAAGRALATMLMERSYQRLQEWWATEHTFPKEWRDAAHINDSTIFMTPSEVAEMGEAITAMIVRFNERSDPAKRPEGARPIHMTAAIHPLPPQTPAD